MVVSSKPGQTLEAYDAVFLAENVGEAAFGHTAMQRHLAAFKAAHHTRTTARTLAFMAAGRGLSHARAIPRPTRFFFSDDFFGALSFDKSMFFPLPIFELNDFDQVRHLGTMPRMAGVQDAR